MKKLIVMFTVMLASAAFVNAQDTTGTQSDRIDQSSTSQDQDMNQNWDMSDKDVITTSELPENIRQQLQSQDYSGWAVKNTYRKMKNDETIYGVELGNGDQMKKLKFDAQGNLIKEKTKRDKDQ